MIFPIYPPFTLRQTDPVSEMSYIQFNKKIRTMDKVHKAILFTCRLVLLRFGYRCSQRVGGFHGRLPHEQNLFKMYFLWH
jgi:hypothetical protein